VRTLGSTGLPVTPLGLGLAALGRPAYINLDRTADLGSDRSVAAMEDRCHRMLDAAYAAGVCYFDAARSYGRAEAFLATWLTRRNPPPGTITIGSKWGYSYVGDWRLEAGVHEVKNLSVDQLRRQFAESRELLGTRLQLYQIHSATLESGVLEDRAVLDELVRLRAAGLAVGLTVSGPRQPDVIRRALQVNVDGRNPFQVVQATWNLLEPSAGAALAEARALGWGVIIKESLANGRLTVRNREPHLTALASHAAAHLVPMETYALAAALSQSWADVVLTGAVTLDQLRDNLAALTLSVDATDLGIVAETPDEYWTKRSALTWT
jgi:aryl-alcohol dehydrogenase-like predicted oxidoreductase